MSEHTHEFIGDVNGVYCEICGMRLTAEEYREFLTGKPKTAETAEKPTKKRSPKKKEE